MKDQGRAIIVASIVTFMKAFVFGVCGVAGLVSLFVGGEGLQLTHPHDAYDCPPSLAGTDDLAPMSLDNCKLVHVHAMPVAGWEIVVVAAIVWCASVFAVRALQGARREGA